MPASIAAISSRDSGRVMSIPDTSPAKTGVIREMLIVIALSPSGCLCHRHRGAGNGCAAHVTGPRLIIAARAMHDLAVVPDHQVPGAPCVRVDKLRLRRVFGQIADEGAGLRYRPADDRADMRCE